MRGIRAISLTAAVACVAGLLAGCVYHYPSSPESGPCQHRRDLVLHAPTVGAHSLLDPAVAQDLGADMVRVIAHDQTIAQARSELEAGHTPEFVQNLEAFEAAGIEVVLSLRWPEQPGVPGADPDRIPTGADRDAQLEQVRWLVGATAGRIQYLQLGNEVMGGPGHYEPDQADAAVDWLQAVATEICTARNADPALANLRIVSPALTGVDGASDGTATPQVTTAINTLIDFAERYTDLLDVHLHSTGVDSIQQQLDWLHQQTTMPLVTLEWSQAKNAASWLSAPADPQFGTGTNGDVVEAAYTDPMTPAEWSVFTATAPYDETFLSDAYAVFQHELVQLAAYGIAWQFGNPAYDLKALFTNQTTQPTAPNEPFNSAFRAIAAESDS